MGRTNKPMKPLNSADVCKKIKANTGNVSIPVVNYDGNGRPTLGHKTVNLITGKNVG